MTFRALLFSDLIFIRFKMWSDIRGLFQRWEMKRWKQNGCIYNRWVEVNGGEPHQVLSKTSKFYLYSKNETYFSVHALERYSQFYFCFRSAAFCLSPGTGSGGIWRGGVLYSTKQWACLFRNLVECVRFYAYVNLGLLKTSMDILAQDHYKYWMWSKEFEPSWKALLSQVVLS